MASDEFYKWLMEDLDGWKRLIDDTWDGISKMEPDNRKWKQVRQEPIRNGAKVTFVADVLGGLQFNLSIQKGGEYT